MPLIKDFQQDNSGVPKPPTTVKIPKPASATVETPNLISAFEEGNPADLEIAPNATALPESVAAPEPAPQPQSSGLNLTQYLGSSTPIPLPAFDAPVVPQGTSLWKDTQINLGVPNLYDPKIVTTQEPTLYRNPLSTGSAAVDQANSNLRSTVQRTNASLDEQARNAQASQVALQNATRSALPNTPDATKPWYGQVTDGLSRWAFGSPAAEAAAKRGEVNVAKGSYGVNGAGAGGLFNYLNNIAIGSVLSLQSTINRGTVEGVHQAAKLTNPPLREPVLRKDPFSGKEFYVKLRYNELNEKEQREYVARGFNQQLAWTGFNQPVSDLTGETNYLGGLLTGQRTARLAEPNPNLSGKQTAGAFYSAKKKVEGFFEEPQTAIPEILYNLLTPGNKIDVAGEVVGRAIGFVAKPLVKKVAPIFRRAAGSKPVARAEQTAVKKPIITPPPKSSVSAQSAAQQVEKLQLPAPKPDYKYEVDPALAVSAPISRPVTPKAITAQGKPLLALPPAVEGIPNYKPTQTPVFPKTDGVGLAAEVGIGTPGRIIEFTPETSTRSLDNIVQKLRTGTPEEQTIVKGFTGSTWEDWRIHIEKNHSDLDVGQFGSIGTKVEEINPAPPKLSDLTEQATELAEQRVLVEQPIQQLEQIFDEAVDLGRRTDNRLPFTKLTAEDFYRAIDNGAKPPLVDEALNIFERDIAEALQTNNIEALSKVRFEYQQQQIAKALELHNAALEPSPLLTAEAKFPRFVSTEAPRTVFHGTALERFTPDYNVDTFGSRGELGNGLYTTTNKAEAESYAKAVVGENRSAEIAYEPIAPQVVELDTSAFKAPLNARATIAAQTDEAKAVINSFSAVEDKRAVARAILDSPKKTYADYVALAERRLAETNASEQALQTYNKRLSRRLRGLGYDAVHDPKSGWFAAIDNGKLKTVKAEPVAEPASAIEGAISRYNADTTAAAAYPDHLTSDANLRDSAYKVLDQARASIDEKLAEVQSQAQAEIANAVQDPVVKVAEPPASVVDDAVVSSVRVEADAVQTQAVEVFDKGNTSALSELTPTDYSQLDSKGLRAKAVELGINVEGINFRSPKDRDELRLRLQGSGSYPPKSILEQQPTIDEPKTPREMAAEYLANNAKEQPSENLTVPESDELKELREIQKNFEPGTVGYKNYAEAIEEQIVEDAKAYEILVEQNSGRYFPNIGRGSVEKKEAIKELKRLGSKKAKDYYATYMYTEDIYDVNRALRLSSTSQKLQKFVDRLYKELNTIPDFQGTVHRGSFPGEHTDSLKVGDVFTDKGFLSTNNAAHDGLYDLPVQFYFESYSGKAINQHIGFDTGSDEVLFFPNTKFKITSIEETAEGKIIRGYETNEPLGKAPEPLNPHETTTDMLNSANEEPPSLCNL